MISQIYIPSSVRLVLYPLILGILTGCGGSSTADNGDPGVVTPTPPAQTTPVDNSVPQLPLISMQNFTYQGAFRVSSATYGESSMNYAAGEFIINPQSGTIIVAGHDHHDAIAEFTIPEIVNTTNINEVNTTTDAVQLFKPVFNRTQTGSTNGIDTISGLHLYNGSLIVNGVQFYDADANNTQTTVIVEDAADFGSTVHGFYELEGAAHAAGWISEIPAEWQNALGGDLLFGYASNESIVSRWSVGPSAFIVDSDQALLNVMNQNSRSIATRAALDFSLTNYLFKESAYTPGESWGQYGYNVSLQNNLWTEISKAHYGFIIPGTSTYVTIGSSGGHEFGIGYKITQDNGNVCGGPCTVIASDNYNYYWLWDVRDLVKVLNGDLLPHEPRPYEYGKFITPEFQPDFTRIVGGYFDATDNSLYVSLNQAGQLGDFDNPPLFLKYSFAE